MIKDIKRKSEIVMNWKAVRILQKSLTCEYLVPGYGFINEKSPDETYNLPFVLAFAVLDDFFSELREQGDLKCKSWMLGPKMKAAKNILTWKNYDLVLEGKEARDNLAHKGICACKNDCLMYIDAIENELKGWSIL